jgi:hypothetical protein
VTADPTARIESFIRAHDLVEPGGSDRLVDTVVA